MTRIKNEILKDFADFSCIALPELQGQLTQFHQLVNDEWRTLDATDWNDKSKRFYGQSEHYILDLLNGNPDRSTIEQKLEQFGVWRVLECLPPHVDILEFGGGVGGTCQLFAERGHHVTYLDIPGKPMEFAQWRFRKYGIPISVIESNPEKLTLVEDYDFIFSDAVFEHLIDPCQVANELMRHLRPSGFLLLLIDTCNINELWPMHAAIDFNALDNTVSDRGGRLVQYSKNRLFNLWRKYP